MSTNNGDTNNSERQAMQSGSCPRCYCNPEQDPEKCTHPQHLHGWGTLAEGDSIRVADMPAIIADAERRVRLAAGSDNTAVRVVAGSGVVLADALAEAARWKVSALACMADDADGLRVRRVAAEMLNEAREDSDKWRGLWEKAKAKIDHDTGTIHALILALETVLPFMDDDFPNGPNEYACVTPAYRAAYKQALVALAEARGPAKMDSGR